MNNSPHAPRSSLGFVNRRGFLGSTIGGITSTLAFGAVGIAAEENSTEKYADLFSGSGAPNTLFLTWQRDPTTTMTIQWIAPDSKDDATVHCRSLSTSALQSKKTISKDFPNTDLKVYRCELTGLDPGTDYEFQIGKVQVVHRFQTMPAKATDAIQFVSGGDSGVNEHAIANNILAARQNPHFALLGGDLAYDNGRSPETFTKFLQNYCTHMVDAKGRLIPMISCIGNHEVDGGYQRERSKSPQYLSVFDGLFAEQTYGVLDFGDYMSIVLLDSNHLSPVEGEQTDWLARTLQEREECPHLIVANHVPAYPSVRNPIGEDGKGGTGEDQREHWCPLFERYKVDVVLEHHDHAFKRTHPLTNGHQDKHGVLYLGDGSWGKIRSPESPKERPYLAVSSEAYHVAVHRLEGQRQFHVALQDTGRIADVCVTESKRPSRRG